MVKWSITIDNIEIETSNPQIELNKLIAKYGMFKARNMKYGKGGLLSYGEYFFPQANKTAIIKMIEEPGKAVVGTPPERGEPVATVNLDTVYIIRGWGETHKASTPDEVRKILADLRKKYRVRRCYKVSGSKNDVVGKYKCYGRRFGIITVSKSTVKATLSPLKIREEPLTEEEIEKFKKSFRRKYDNIGIKITKEKVKPTPTPTPTPAPMPVKIPKPSPKGEKPEKLTEPREIGISSEPDKKSNLIKALAILGGGALLFKLLR